MFNDPDWLPTLKLGTGSTKEVDTARFLRKQERKKKLTLSASNQQVASDDPVVSDEDGFTDRVGTNSNSDTTNLANNNTDYHQAFPQMPEYYDNGTQCSPNQNSSI